ncbi:MAG: rRNA maturation RNase YbeY [Deltaproteobacteria bacterium]
MNIAVVDETGELDGKYKSRLRKIAGTVLKNMDVPDDAELCVSFIADKRMRELNRTYRSMDRTTDVLTFPQGEGPGHTLLGDIVISLDTARRHSVSYGNTPEEEIKKLIVHGILHLLGHDHKKKKEKETMRQKEDELLAVLKEL